MSERDYDYDKQQVIIDVSPRSSLTNQTYFD